MTRLMETSPAQLELNDCPVEILFEICSHLDDHHDLLSLSATSKLIRYSISQFTRVVTNHQEQLTYFQGFQFCQRVDLDKPVPDWSINLVELLYGPTMTPMLPDSFYTQGHHMKNYVALVVPPRPQNQVKLKGEYSLMFMNWSIKRLTNVFNGRFVLITPEPSIQVLNRMLENTTIRAPNAENVLLTQVDYRGNHPLHMTPLKLTLDTCTNRLLRGICFDKMEDLRISAPSRGDEGQANFHFHPSNIPDMGIVDGLSNLSCPNLKRLEIRNVNHLTNLQLPQLEKLYAVFTTYSQSGPVIPRMENVNISKIDTFDLWSYAEVPIIANVQLPKTCSHFCINYQPLSIEKPLVSMNDITHPRWRFAMPEGKKISIVNGLGESTDDILKHVTTLTTSGVSHDIAKLTGEEKLNLPKLKSITIHDVKSTNGNDIPTSLSLLNMTAHSLESLSISRSTSSRIVIDLNSFAHEFPQLKSLTIAGVGKDVRDIYLPGLVFPKLQSLFLFSMDLESLVELFDCLDLASIGLTELKLDRCTTSNVNCDDSPGLIRHLLRSIHGFKETLTMLDISLTKDHPSIHHSAPLKLENFSKLQDLTLNVDTRELELRECNVLKEINLSYRDTPLIRLTATSLPVLEKLSYNVAQHDDNEKEGTSRRGSRSIQEMCDGIEHFQEWGRIRRDIHVVGGWQLR